jgi:hypothetical protein
MPDCYFQKTAGGILLPADDETADYLTSIKTDTYLKSKITKPRNYKFLQRAMVFFGFCFSHWDAETNWEFLDERAQKERFRHKLTILAGYYIETWDPFTGQLELTAQSLSYESMNEDTFRECYLALTQAAMKHVFKGSDERIYNKLVSFF